MKKNAPFLDLASPRFFVPGVSILLDVVELTEGSVPPVKRPVTGRVLAVIILADAGGASRLSSAFRH